MSTAAPLPHARTVVRQLGDNLRERMSTNPRFSGATPFSRLALAHAASVCGDACLVIALANSLFFALKPGEARPKVILYLLLTVAPFAIVAPILGPALDRTRGGRRTLMAVGCAGRAVLMWMLAGVGNGLALYPLAFGMLVLSKGHAVAKSALVPAVVRDPHELVEANSRLALISGLAAVVGGLPAVAIAKVLGVDWALRFGALIFVLATVLSMKIPRAQRVAGPLSPEERHELHTRSIVVAGTAMAALRLGVGFLTLLAAFTLKREGQPAWFYLLVVVAATAGNFLGAGVAPAIGARIREEKMLAGSLLIPAVVALFGARSHGRAAITFVALIVAVGAATGRQAFDSLVQRDAPDAARGRAFAGFETRFQVTWVLGALLPVLLEVSAQMGFFLLALVFGFAGLTYVGALRSPTATSPTELWKFRRRPPKPPPEPPPPDPP